ncbi:MAG: DNA mismatch repair protein MutT [Candidatus Cloacimonas sp. SDB]|nr:MAG: DNA mismatch repair protein MutT [Candidatus Cloacimonas sp. SDB]
MILGTLCYIRKNGKTLMLHRNKQKGDFHLGKYNGLGGKLEPGESPEDCVIREIKEESGLNIQDPVLKGIITFPKFDMVNDWYVFLFVADNFTGELIPSPEGELKWVDTERLQELPLWEGDRIFLPWLQQDKFFSGKFCYENKQLKDWKVNFYQS